MTSISYAGDQHHRQRWLPILLTICLAEIIFVLESMMMFAAMPRAMAENSGSAAAGWLITAYFIVSAASAALCSVLGDRYGRKRMLMIVFCGAAFGSIVSATHDELSWIIAGRAIQGLAGAILPLCYGLVKENLPPGKMAFGIGALSASGTIGSSAGFILAGIIIDNGHWQQIFTLSAVLSFAMAGVCAIVLPRSPKRIAGRLDILGGVLFVPGILAVMYAVSVVKVIGWSALAYAGPGIAILVAWLFIELRHSNPLINVRLFRVREIFLSNLLVMFVFLGAFYLEQVYPLLMQNPPSTGIGFGLSATATGLIKLPSALLVACSALLAGPMVTRWGPRPLIVSCAIAIIACWLGLLIATSFWLTVLLCLVLPIFIVMLATGAVSVIVAAAPSDRTSEAAGMNGVLNAIAKGIGGIFVASLLATTTLSVEGQAGVFPSPDSFRLVYFYMIATGVCVLLAGLALPTRGAQRPAKKASSHSEAPGAPGASAEH